MLKRNKGITLIALVVTIIVLLILAGISITMLTGQNGILTNAAKAKNETGEAQIEEKVKLSVADALTRGTGTLEDENLKSALNSYIGKDNYEIIEDKENGWTVTVKANEKSYNISSTGSIKKVAALPTQKGVTEPYLPSDDFEMDEGTSLGTGLVIKDSVGNEYVWVEVPTTIYKNSKYNTNGEPSSSTDYDKIEKCLKAYTSDYSDSNCSNTNASFKTQYQDMLKSVYENGGFWIGRYEAGLEEGKSPRTSYSTLENNDKAVIKSDMYPYNYVKRNEAQTLAEGMNYEGVTSSLIFGVQWNLVLKYIEEKTVAIAEEANKNTARTDIQNKLASNSIPIGNYYYSEFTLNRGKFAQKGALSKWYKFNSEEKNILVTGSQKKRQSESSNAILLTTGATEATRLQNIYDIAGNVYEWTLEFGSTSYPCISRGGSCDSGSGSPANYHNRCDTSYSDYYVGFRVGLWK